MSLTMSEQLMHSTVRIEIINKDGLIMSTGTGFFFRYSVDEDKVVPVLVTNKHVIKDAEIGRLVFTIADTDGKPVYGEKFAYVINDFEQSFILHPDNNVDLCIMLIQPILAQASKNYNKKLFTISLEENLIPTIEQIQALSVLEDVIMIGYPNGLWEESNNLPIIRRGVTAIHPKFDYNQKTDIVLDMACFPGSSGSPIFIYNQGSYPTGNGITIGSRLILLGILYAGPLMTAVGEIQTKTIPTADISFARTNLMINIGYAIKSRRLLDFKPIIDKLINKDKQI